MVLKPRNTVFSLSFLKSKWHIAHNLKVRIVTLEDNLQIIKTNENIVGIAGVSRK